MQKQLLFFVLMICFASANAQKNTSACCPPASATTQFALLANDKNFVMQHDAPLPFHYKSANGTDITFKAADGTDAHGWMVKASKPTSYYLFVFQEWWGLNDYIKQETEKLANELGINAIAIDLYDKQIATTPDEARKLVQAVKAERAVNIIKGAYNYAGADAKVFTIGWCFGGGWSLQAALLGGSSVEGCIMYYGMPEKDVNELKKLHGDVIGFFAKKDGGITPAIVEAFKTNMKAAGKNLTAYEYDAVHAFANPSNPDYNKEATADAHAKTIAFIKARIK
ncbi:dienelactone hydrolase family protein [Parafilimonas sp.]|uniref:dienelactone hydrolase family protein n=1 Tax=Parafilimonas sp. TaxID=1969739 RepID=UPI0039E3CA65